MANIQNTQREPNPDVNSYSPDVDPTEDTQDDNDSIPVPPDATPAVPVEEPPSSDRAPVGDVDDSPKRIA